MRKAAKNMIMIGTILIYILYLYCMSETIDDVFERLINVAGYFGIIFSIIWVDCGRKKQKKALISHEIKAFYGCGGWI